MGDRSGSGLPHPFELVRQVTALRDQLARGRTTEDDEIARTRAELDDIQAHLKRLSGQLAARGKTA